MASNSLPIRFAQRLAELRGTAEPRAFVALSVVRIRATEHADWIPEFAEVCGRCLAPLSVRGLCLCPRGGLAA